MRMYIPSTTILLGVFLIAMIEYSAFLVGMYNIFTFFLGVIAFINIFVYDIERRQNQFMMSDLIAYKMVVDVMKLDNPIAKARERVERVKNGVKQHGNDKRRNNV